MSKLEDLMNALVGGGESEDEGSMDMEKMKKAHKLLKKATELIGECCGEDDMEEDDDEEDGKAMPVATTFVIQKSKR
jgi:hypothetical protein